MKDPIKLDDTTLEEYRQWTFEYGRDAHHTEVFDALHEGACETVEAFLTSKGIDSDDLDDDQLNKLIRAYKDGFWEPAHKTERKELKAQVAALSGSLSDMIFSAPSAPDVRFPGMFVPRVPTLSTAHITKEDGDRLQHNYIPALIGRSPDGAILHIGESDDDPEEEFAEFSEAFRNIVLRLKEAGYNYVRFDNAQENIPAFPTFDW